MMAKEKMKEEVDESLKPGWMLKADPKLAAAVKAKQDINKKREASYGKPSAGISVPRTPKNEYDRKVDSYLNKNIIKKKSRSKNQILLLILICTRHLVQLRTCNRVSRP